MKITYDKRADVLYVGFRETTVTTKEFEDGLAIDYAQDGTLAGIEFLDASERLGK